MEFTWFQSVLVYRRLEQGVRASAVGTANLARDVDTDLDESHIARR
jgi:hypothetical protein